MSSAEHARSLPPARTAWGRFLQERVPVDVEALRYYSNEPVPLHLKHWWWCLGGTPALLFGVQVVTGILLSFYYVPDPKDAWESVQRLNTTIDYGWFIRSIHRWSSNLMIAAVILHMMRVYFTGAYRGDQGLNGLGRIGFRLHTASGDKTFLYIENPSSHMHVAMTMVLDPSTMMISPA